MTDDAERLPRFDETAAWVVFSAKEAVVAPLRPLLRHYNITEPQWRAMRVINDRRIIDATGLAEAAMLHPTSVSRILRDLEKRKLIVRQPDAGDRRRSVVALSPDGRELVRTLSWHVLHLMRGQSQRFGAERMAHLIEELLALKEALKDVK
jgi:homoprotocatechuate degradation regulator HpaR